MGNKTSKKPNDKEHNYGHEKADALMDSSISSNEEEQMKALAKSTEEVIN